MVHGRSQIEAFWKSWFDRIAEVNLTTVDVVPLGSDAAREVGTAVILTTGHLAEKIAGKYMVVWRQVEGEWKLEADMWNNNG
jgi:ketosteroid isomerase-like protein